MITTLTSSNFQSEVIDSPIPVLIDFWAPWCVPCKALAPILDSMSESATYKGLKFCSINTDSEYDLATQHQIVSVPTLVLYKDGQVLDSIPGGIPRRSIESFIKERLDI